MMRRLGRTLPPLAAALAFGLAGSGHAARVPAAVETTDPARVEALLINGGGTPAGNYQSHLMHVRLLADILRDSGVPDRRITILSAVAELLVGEERRRGPLLTHHVSTIHSS